VEPGSETAIESDGLDAQVGYLLCPRSRIACARASSPTGEEAINGAVL
jgi:hypothetical protein